jgi:predicted porin
LGVKAVEDLEGGLKAVGVLEYALDIAISTSIGAARQQYVALAGGFGTVAAGYLQTAGYDFTGLFDPTAGSAVTSANFVHVSNFIYQSARAAHAAAYISPNISGLTIAVNHAFDFGNVGAVASTDTTTAGNKTTANELSATYQAGPLTVAAIYVGTANDGNNYAKITEMALGASYDLTVVKLFGSYQNTKTDSTTSLGTDSAMAFNAVAPVTATGAAVLSYGKSTINSAAHSATIGNKSSFTVAWLESLSKTTTAYAAYQKGTVDATSSIDSSVLAVGLRKKF